MYIINSMVWRACVVLILVYCNNHLFNLMWEIVDHKTLTFT